MVTINSGRDTIIQGEFITINEIHNDLPIGYNQDHIDHAISQINTAVQTNDPCLLKKAVKFIEGISASAASSVLTKLVSQGFHKLIS